MAYIFLVAVIRIESNLTETSDPLLAASPFSNGTKVASTVWLFKTDLGGTDLKRRCYQRVIMKEPLSLVVFTRAVFG